jgi:hypothetical protein
MRALLTCYLILMSLAWSLLEGCLLPLRIPLPAVAANSQRRAHADYCHCRLCPGTQTCCCRPTSDRVLAAILLAACDTSLSATLIFKIPRALPPACIGPLHALPEVVLTLPTSSSLARLRPRTPPKPPPRLLQLHS